MIGNQILRGFKKGINLYNILIILLIKYKIIL
jgi:hypothetical protein